MIYITGQRCHGEDGLTVCREQQVKPETAQALGLTNPQARRRTGRTQGKDADDFNMPRTSRVAVIPNPENQGYLANLAALAPAASQPGITLLTGRRPRAACRASARSRTARRDVPSSEPAAATQRRNG